MDKNLERYDTTLIEELQRLGDAYGPLGVALAAARLTDRATVISQLIADTPVPMVCPCCGSDTISPGERGRYRCFNGDVWMNVNGNIVVLARVKRKD